MTEDKHITYMITGDAMKVITADIRESERLISRNVFKERAEDKERARIWLKLRNEAAKHRKNGKYEIADVLDELRKWIKGNPFLEKSE